MRSSEPTYEAVLEQLLERAAALAGQSRQVAFEEALGEAVRFHRFLLRAHASTFPDGSPANYAAMADFLSSPSREWTYLYGSLFARVAEHVFDQPRMFAAVASVPISLLRAEAQALPASILADILTLGPNLMHRLSDRFARERDASSSALPRAALDTYSSAIVGFVGNWNSVGEAVADLRRSRAARSSEEDEWARLGRVWPVAFDHLENTAYMMALAAWNDDATGAHQFARALLDWMDLLEYRPSAPYPAHVPLPAELLEAPWPQASERARRILGPNNSVTPRSLFLEIGGRAHSDVVTLAAALMLHWASVERERTPIAAPLARGLLHRSIPERIREFEPSTKADFGDVLAVLVRLGTTESKTRARLDRLVEVTDRIRERLVVANKVYEPSTLHHWEDLRAQLLALSLAALQSDQPEIPKAIRMVARDVDRLPDGDHGLRRLARFASTAARTLEAGGGGLKAGLETLEPGANLEKRSVELAAALTGVVDGIERERTARIDATAPDPVKLRKIERAVEEVLLSGSWLPDFLSTTIEPTSVGSPPSERTTITVRSVDRGSVITPSMSESGSLKDTIADGVADTVRRRLLHLVRSLPRERVRVRGNVETRAFWAVARSAAAGFECPIAMLVPHAQAGIVWRWRHGRGQKPEGLRLDFCEGKERGYVATVEGIDLFRWDLPEGLAVLIPRQAVQRIGFGLAAPDKRIDVTWEPAGPGTVDLQVHMVQQVIASETPRVEINIVRPVSGSHSAQPRSRTKGNSRM